MLLAAVCCCDLLHGLKAETNRTSQLPSTPTSELQDISLEERFKNDLLWRSLPDTERELLKHFGLNAASSLYHYTKGLDSLLSEAGGIARKALPNQKKLSVDLPRQNPTVSQLLTGMDNLSQTLYGLYGVKTLLTLNEKSNKNEDLLIEAIKHNTTLSESTKSKIMERAAALARQLHSEANTRKTLSSYTKKLYISEVNTTSADQCWIPFRSNELERLIGLARNQTYRGEPYLANKTSKEAVKFAKKCGDIDGQINGFTQSTQAIARMDTRQDQEEARALLDEINLFTREYKIDRIGTYNHFTVTLLKGQLLTVLTHSEDKEAELNKKRKNALDNLMIACRIAKANRYTMEISVCLGNVASLYSGQKLDSIDREIKATMPWLLETASAPYLSPNQKASLRLVLSNIAEKDHDIPSAVTHAKTASIIAQDQNIKITADGIIQRLMDDNRKIFYENRYLNDLRIGYNALWNQLIYLNFHERLQILKGSRWGLALAPYTGGNIEGVALNGLLLYELNIRNLALEAERYLEHNKKNKKEIKTHGFLRVQDIQAILSKNEYLVVIGSIKTEFGEDDNPYRHLRNKAAKDIIWINEQNGKSESYYLVLLSKAKSRFLWLGPTKELNSQLNKLRTNLEENTKDSYEHMRHIGNLLKGDIIGNEKSKTFYIVPNGIFSALPLASIMDAGQKETTPKSTILVLASPRQLLSLKSDKPLDIINSSISIFANPRLEVEKIAKHGAENRSSINELPRTGLEALNVRAALGGGNIFTQDKFTIDNFKKSAQYSGLIHLATHAYFDRDGKGWSSGEEDDAGIIFSDGRINDGSSRQRTILFPQEISSMDLHRVALLTLSGCEGGLSQGFQSETWSGLQRAFYVAGARSTLTALWKVDDAATLEFMTRYYQRLKAGDGRADALAATQKEFRDGIPGKPDWKEPYYWAAWQLVGDWRPISGL